MGENINKEHQQKKRFRKKKKARVVRSVLLTAAFLMIFVLSFGGYKTYAYINGAPELDEQELNLPQSSTIYDAEGNKMRDIIGKEHRKMVSFEDIPEHVVNAFIAVEDVRYWEHNGVDIKRIGGAIVANIQEGFGAEGASTITQQVVKNMLLEPEKTLKRKVQEAYLAVELEKTYSKEEILEMYLNKIYFGQGAYGVATAAQTYFNKSLDELTTAEAALLAGLPQRPSGYDPYKHPDLASDRRATVLSLMEQHGFITEQERKEAEAVSIEDSIVEQTSTTTTNDAFIDQVINDLKKEGIPEEALYSGGLKIYTTLDQQAQKIVDEALTTDAAVTYPDDQFRAGISLIDTQTGAIRAIGGNRQSGKDDVQKGFNYATQLTRSPGSTIKPILDYAPGIEKKKWSTNKQFIDEELELNGKEFSNWNDEFQGSVSIREALQWSYNIPAIKAFMEVGGEEAQAFAEKLGISIDETYPAYAIGGFKTGISPLELSGAYAAFGSGGDFHEPFSVKKVVYPNGKELELASEPERVMSKGTAYMITDMLRTVVDEGTGMQANVNGLDVAGKTGTTSVDEEIKGDGTSDAWFSGYTTNYTAAVWTGYDKTTRETYIHKKDDDIAKLLFQHIMSNVSKGKETAPFEKPESVVELKIDKKTGLRANSATPSSDIIKELYFKGEEPKKAIVPEPKIEEKPKEKPKPEKETEPKKDPEPKKDQESKKKPKKEPEPKKAPVEENETESEPASTKEQKSTDEPEEPKEPEENQDNGTEPPVDQNEGESNSEPEQSDSESGSSEDSDPADETGQTEEEQPAEEQNGNSDAGNEEGSGASENDGGATDDGNQDNNGETSDNGSGATEEEGSNNATNNENEETESSQSSATEGEDSTNDGSGTVNDSANETEATKEPAESEKKKQ
ncbi:PBP1A family penicillin-binding protein [Pseudalkalibacillus hwajinpoensis]|uniref:PBP1A family penicillin-binding protein n=1 Tax=Guptibacillus hwajinpoensis TaxID=208199 RepID=UPI00325AE67B